MCSADTNLSFSQYRVRRIDGIDHRTKRAASDHSPEVRKKLQTLDKILRTLGKSVTAPEVMASGPLLEVVVEILAETLDGYRGQRCYDVSSKHRALIEMIIQTGFLHETRTDMTESFQRMTTGEIVKLHFDLLGTSRGKRRRIFSSLKCTYLELASFLQSADLPPLRSLDEINVYCNKSGLSIMADIGCKFSKSTNISRPKRCEIICWIVIGVFVSAAVSASGAGIGYAVGSYSNELSRQTLEFEKEKDRLSREKPKAYFTDGELPHQQRMAKNLTVAQMEQWRGTSPDYELTDENRQRGEDFIDATIKKMTEVHLMALAAQRVAGVFYVVLSKTHFPGAFSSRLIAQLTNATTAFKASYSNVRSLDFLKERTIFSGEQFGHPYVTGTLGLVDPAVSPITRAADGSVLRSYDFGIVLQFPKKFEKLDYFPKYDWEV